MPQRHDPDITVGTAVVITPYPGARAEKVEQELTRRIEKKVNENPAVERVRSVSRQGLSVVFVELRDEIKPADAIWEDLQTKLQGMTDLPRVDGQPLQPRLDKEFGDTTAVMLTISSPPVSDFEVERRAESIRAALADARARRPPEYRRTIERRPCSSIPRRWHALMCCGSGTTSANDCWLRGWPRTS